MRIAAAVVFGVASVAVAQDSGICAQDIVDACVDQYDRQISKCVGNDYICLCNTYSNKLVCYDNCPSSKDKPPVQNQVTQFCLAAAPLSSASIASAKSAMNAAKTASAPVTTASNAPATSHAASATIASASGFGSGQTGAAVAMPIPMGGAVAVMFGLAGLL